MKRFSILSALAFALTLVFAPVHAEERGTEAEAQALLNKAVSYVKENGMEGAQAFFSNPANGYIDRDLYVTIISMEGVSLVHATNSKIVGKAIIGLKDLDKKPFIQNTIEDVKKTGKSILDYKWSDPLTKKIRDKRMFSEKVKDVIVSVGAYKQ